MNRLSYITLYFFATLLAFKSHSQNTDSLKLVLKKATTDSTKCITLIALGDYVAQTNGDSALSFFKKSEAISKANILIAKDSKTKK